MEKEEEDLVINKSKLQIRAETELINNRRLYEKWAMRWNGNMDRDEGDSGYATVESLASRTVRQQMAMEARYGENAPDIHELFTRDMPIGVVVGNSEAPWVLNAEEAMCNSELAKTTLDLIAKGTYTYKPEGEEGVDWFFVPDISPDGKPQTSVRIGYKDRRDPCSVNMFAYIPTVMFAEK